MGDLAAFLAARLDEDESNVPAWLAPPTPSRARYEVEAKRAILADYEEAAQHPYDLPEGVREGRDDDERERDQYLIDVLEHVLRCLAAVYRDHPHYDEAWCQP